MPIWYLPNGAMTYGTSPTATVTAANYPLWITASATTTTPTYATVWTAPIQRPAQTWARQVAETDRLIAEYEAVERRVTFESAARAEQRTLLRRQAESAKRRARDLLLEHLTPAQRETFMRKGWFIVENVRTKNRYRIRERDSLVANVDRLYESAGIKERVLHRLCAHLDIGALPLHDHLLAQKMMLEHAEDDFLRIANRHAA